MDSGDANCKALASDNSLRTVAEFAQRSDRVKASDVFVGGLFLRLIRDYSEVTDLTILRSHIICGHFCCYSNQPFALNKTASAVVVQTAFLPPSKGAIIVRGDG